MAAPDTPEDGETVFMPSQPSAGPITESATHGRVSVGDVLNGIYEVKRLIRRGGMGEVYEGINIASDERVAIKVMLPSLAADPKVQAMFRKEARTLTRMAHPALVQYRVLAQEPRLNVLYIVTEFVDGVELTDVLGQVEPTSPVLKALMRRLADGLRAAHELGAVHRDISPDNVLLPDRRLDHARIIDFGIAKDLDPSKATIIGDGFAGKLGYVAPEQFGDFGRDIGPWTDVYSLGLVILAVASGKDVDMGSTLVEAVDKRRAGVDVNAAPEDLRPVLSRMLAADPVKRARSMDEVLAMIDDRPTTLPPVELPISVAHTKAAQFTVPPVTQPPAPDPVAAAPVSEPTAPPTWTSLDIPVVAAPPHPTTEPPVTPSATTAPPVTLPPLEPPPVAEAPAPVEVVREPTQPPVAWAPEPAAEAEPPPAWTPPEPVAAASPPPIPAPVAVAPAPKPAVARAPAPAAAVEPPAARKGGGAGLMIGGGLVALALVGGAVWMFMPKGHPAPAAPTSPSAAPSGPIAAAPAPGPATPGLDAVTNIPCGWLSASQTATSLAVTGFAGTPATVQDSVSAAAKAAGVALPSGGVDASGVQPAPQGACAALDALRPFKAPSPGGLTTDQPSYQIARGADGKYTGVPTITISPHDSTKELAVLAVSPAGGLSMVYENRQALAAAPKPSVTDAGGDSFQLQNPAFDIPGRAGVLLLTGKGPFDAALLTKPASERDAAWAAAVKQAATAGGWQANLTWYDVKVSAPQKRRTDAGGYYTHPGEPGAAPSADAPVSTQPSDQPKKSSVWQRVFGSGNKPSQAPQQ
jgi:serine/threonine protein kinase